MGHKNVEKGSKTSWLARALATPQPPPGRTMPEVFFHMHEFRNGQSSLTAH